MSFSAGQKLTAEALGTGLLLAIVVGSGVMGEALAGGNDAIALLGNTIATGAGLVVLITIFGPISGAHLNPAVTFGFALKRDIAPAMAGAYMAAQIAGAIAGVLLAHAMFDLEIVQQSMKARAGLGQALGEGVAAFGLMLTILGAIRFRPDAVAMGVGLFITAGYWFTSSTSFANPAVTLARTLTDSFSGIRAADAPAFIFAQFIAAAGAVACARYLFNAEAPARPAPVTDGAERAIAARHDERTPPAL